MKGQKDEMWTKNGNEYYLREAVTDCDALPPYVYQVETPGLGPTHLSYRQDHFEFPYKVYGQMTFPERVRRTFECTSGNLGVLMTGLKGTGKTVEAEHICNFLKLPVILVGSKDPRVLEFLNEIPCDVVVFIDEYEKIFERSDAMLSMMDGALRTKHRRVFLLTTNETYISDSMLNRPSRILYVKRYDNLEIDVIQEIVDDMLPTDKQRKSAMAFFPTLEILTVDIVKAVCNQMLIFGESPNEFKHLMNVSRLTGDRKNVYSVVKGIGAQTRVATYVMLNPSNPFNIKIEDDEECVPLDFFDEQKNNWVSLGVVLAHDEKTRTVQTEQGTFLIEDAMLHPSFLAKGVKVNSFSGVLA